MSPMFEAMPGFMKTAKNYWFGKDRPRTPGQPDDGGQSAREKIMTAANKNLGGDRTQGGVGGALQKVMKRNKLLAAAGDM